MTDDFAIVVLISGRGSNLKSLIDRADGYRVAGVVSAQPEAGGLALARAAGIPVDARARAAFPTLMEHKDALYAAVRGFEPDLVVLAGFMQIVASHFVEEFRGRLVNIHPSLLPDLPGLHTHERAVQEGRTVHGCTVHYVDAGVDTGPVIAQASCPVERGDTAETLGARVLEREHRLYPWAVRGIAREDIVLEADRVRYSEKAVREAAEQDFMLKRT